MSALAAHSSAGSAGSAGVPCPIGTSETPAACSRRQAERPAWTHIAHSVKRSTPPATRSSVPSARSSPATILGGPAKCPPVILSSVPQPTTYHRTALPRLEAGGRQLARSGAGLIVAGNRIPARPPAPASPIGRGRRYASNFGASWLMKSRIREPASQPARQPCSASQPVDRAPRAQGAERRAAN